MAKHRCPAAVPDGDWLFSRYTGEKRSASRTVDALSDSSDVILRGNYAVVRSVHVFVARYAGNIKRRLRCRSAIFRSIFTAIFFYWSALSPLEDFSSTFIHCFQIHLIVILSNKCVCRGSFFFFEILFVMKNTNEIWALHNWRHVPAAISNTVVMYRKEYQED